MKNPKFNPHDNEVVRYLLQKFRDFSKIVSHIQLFCQNKDLKKGLNRMNACCLHLSLSSSRIEIGFRRTLHHLFHGKLSLTRTYTLSLSLKRTHSLSCTHTLTHTLILISLELSDHHHLHGVQLTHPT